MSGAPGIRGGVRNDKLPGLAQMVAAAAPGECPFCGSRRAKRKRSSGRAPLTCGDQVCVKAYFRCWRRDHDRLMRTFKQSAKELINALR